MRLSTRTRYGTRAMVELALAYPDSAVPVKDVARKQNLSPKYLEQIMSALKAADLVRSVRGMHGGYSLSREPDDITLGDVFHVLEGSTAPVDCVDHPESCPIEDVCPTRETWVEMKEAVDKILAKTTIRTLAERKKKKQDVPTYQI
jgi:Rrf2 family protein